jgi:hypothetical protein
VALFVLMVMPSVFRLVPLPDAVLGAIAVLRAGLSGVTLGLVFVGWLLGVLTICTSAALVRLWRAPVVIPWNSRTTLGGGA